MPHSVPQNLFCLMGNAIFDRLLKEARPQIRCEVLKVFGAVFSRDSRTSYVLCVS